MKGFNCDYWWVICHGYLALSVVGTTSVTVEGLSVSNLSERRDLVRCEVGDESVTYAAGSPVPQIKFYFSAFS